MAKWLQMPSTESTVVKAEDFTRTVFRVDIVGAIAEMPTSARLDSLVEPFAKFLGLDWQLGGSGNLKGAVVSCVVLTQPLLHLAQHVVHVDSVAAEAQEAAVSGKAWADACLSSVAEVRKSQLCAASASDMVKHIEPMVAAAVPIPTSSPAVTTSPCPLVCIERANLFISSCNATISQSASKIIDCVTKNFTAALDELIKLKEGNAMSELVEMCAKGDFTDERSKRLMHLIEHEDGVQFYKSYKRCKKVQPIVEEVSKHVQRLEGAFDVKNSSARLRAACETESKEFAGIKDLMGCLLAVQALFRKLRPGETREELAERCRKGMDEHGMTVPPVLSLALSAAKSAVALGVEPETSPSALEAPGKDAPAAVDVKAVVPAEPAPTVAAAGVKHAPAAKA